VLIVNRIAVPRAVVALISGTKQHPAREGKIVSPESKGNAPSFGPELSAANSASLFHDPKQ
jgi:hypothetical protein